VAGRKVLLTFEDEEIMNETHKEQMSRVVQMAAGYPTWYLSDNDRAALRAIVAYAAEQHRALTDLWIWSTEARTHITSDPVPDGLGAQVIAALAKADAFMIDEQQPDEDDE
jgi:hypothetical protein